MGWAKKPCAGAVFWTLASADRRLVGRVQKLGDQKYYWDVLILRIGETKTIRSGEATGLVAAKDAAKRVFQIVEKRRMG